jgi:hypothetical protein
METDMPAEKRWWFSKFTKRGGPCHIILPCGMKSPRLWINEKAIDLSNWHISMDYLRPHIPLPESPENIHIMLRSDVPTDHYLGGPYGTIGLHGGVHISYPCEEEQIEFASYSGGKITIKTNIKTYNTGYKLME